MLALYIFAHNFSNVPTSFAENLKLFKQFKQFSDVILIIRRLLTWLQNY